MIRVLRCTSRNSLLNRRLVLKSWISTVSDSGNNCNHLEHTKITEPVGRSAKVLRHLQFTKRLPFEEGLRIQEQFVRANLDMKELESKIKQKLIELDDNFKGSATINENEKQIIDNILAMKPNPMVLTFEFEPTYTGGKKIKKSMTKEQVSRFENFKPKKQIGNPPPKFVQTERGGEITFHGPGQIVAYIILDLKSFKNFPARCLISAIEKAGANTLKKMPIDENGTQLDISTKKVDNKTGIWAINGEKIASIGVHVRRSITSHGVCINVAPDLSYLNNFEMCGTPNGKATSIENECLNANVSLHDVSINFVRQLAKLLGIDTVERIQTDGAELVQEKNS